MINLVEFAELSPGQKNAFNKSVRQADGRVEVAVHPHYNDDWKNNRLPRTARQIYYTDKHYERIIQSGLPLIFFLEKYGNAKNVLLSKFNPGTKGTAYIVNTISSDPKPISARRTWPRVVETLQTAQTEEVIVGGQYMPLHPLKECLHREGDLELTLLARYVQEEQQSRGDSMPWLKKDFVPYGCAGLTAMWFLYEGFNVRLSPFSSPNQLMTPDDYNKKVGRTPRNDNFYPFNRTVYQNPAVRIITQALGTFQDALTTGI